MIVTSSSSLVLICLTMPQIYKLFFLLRQEYSSNFNDKWGFYSGTMFIRCEKSAFRARIAACVDWKRLFCRRFCFCFATGYSVCGMTNFCVKPRIPWMEWSISAKNEDFCERNVGLLRETGVFSVRNDGFLWEIALKQFVGHFKLNICVPIWITVWIIWIRAIRIFFNNFVFRKNQISNSFCR